MSIKQTKAAVDGLLITADEMEESGGDSVMVEHLRLAARVLEQRTDVDFIRIASDSYAKARFVAEKLNIAGWGWTYLGYARWGHNGLERGCVVIDCRQTMRALVPEEWIDLGCKVIRVSPALDLGWKEEESEEETQDADEESDDREGRSRSSGTLREADEDSD